MAKENGKVTVDVIVAQALDSLLEACTPEGAVADYVNGELAYYPEIRSLSLDTLIRALYIGYEVEKSVEEQLDELLAHLDAEHRNLYNHSEMREKYRFAEEQVRRALEIVLPHLPKGER